MRPNPDWRSAPKPAAGRHERAPWASPVDAGRLNQAEAHPTTMFDLLTPGADSEPAFDAVTAYVRYAERGCGADSGVGPVIVLARMFRNTTYAEGPPNIEPQGTGRLVYVLRWESVTWATSGPAPGKGQPARNHEAIGTRTVILDAQTGEVLREQLSGIAARREA